MTPTDDLDDLISTEDLEAFTSNASLDDLLDDDGDSNEVLILDDLDATADPIPLTPKATPLPIEREVDLSDFVDKPPDVSFISDKGSSRLPGPRRRVRFRHLTKLNLQTHPVKWGREIRLEAEAQAPASNPLDGLSERALLQLVAALQQTKVNLMEGEEVAFITGPIRQMYGDKPMDCVTRLALHLNATPVDGVVFIKMWSTEQELTRGLLKRGLAIGRDYELIDARSLLPYERAALEGLMPGSRKKLRIIRRLSKTQAKT